MMFNKKTIKNSRKTKKINKQRRNYPLDKLC